MRVMYVCMRLYACVCVSVGAEVNASVDPSACPGNQSLSTLSRLGRVANVKALLLSIILHGAEYLLHFGSAQLHTITSLQQSLRIP